MRAGIATRLAASTRSSREGVRPAAASALTLLNVACLLEPAVGVVWQRAIARAVSAHVGWHHSALLALGLWLVYATDRLLDASTTQVPNTSRHAFFARHASLAWRIVAAVAGASLVLAATTLTRVDWIAAGVAVLLALSYLAGVHLARVGRAAKKTSAAAVYTLGVAAFLAPTSPSPPRLALWLVVFAVLAACNLVLISAVETPGWDRAQRAVRATCVVLAACLVTWGMVDLASSVRVLATSVALSFALLAALSFPSSLRRDVQHALADVALLLPVLACF